jgi:hypothetical protein
VTTNPQFDRRGFAMTCRLYRVPGWARTIPLAVAVLLLPAWGWGSRRPALSGLPLSFVANQGQADPAVRFQAHALGGTVFFTPSEVVLTLHRTSPATGAPRAARDLELGGPAGGAAPRGVPARVLRLRFKDAARHVDIAGAERLPGIVNFFRGGDPARWRTHVPTYASIVYRDLYPGIDLRYEGVEGRLKGSYIVAPGADPSRIRWSYSGARSARIDDQGNLLLALSASGEKGAAAAAASTTVLMETKPVAWQELENGRRPVPVHYEVARDGSIGFALPAGHDPAHPLVLDPTLTYSTFLGGGSVDVGYDVAVDASGDYLTGYTLSTDFPTDGPIDPGCGTDGNCDGFSYYDAFVAKLNPAVAGAAGLIFATYLGGSDHDFGVRIAVDGNGASYVTGLARAGFPTTPNAFQQTYGGPPGADAFLSKLSADGSQLLYSTFLGGSGGDGAWGIALDASNIAYLAGQTTSTNFPATPGALDMTCGTDGACNGLNDAFMAKLNPGASGAASLVYATYLGGSGEETAFGIARDATNQVYLTGRTASTNFPTAGVPFQSSNGGDFDAFLAKLNTAGSALLYSTYFGGGSYEDAYAVALGAANRAYLLGKTSSVDLPVSAGAFQSSYGGGMTVDTASDAFFAKLDPALAGPASRTYASYLGGSHNDEGYGLAVDASDVAYVAGFARSTDFPTTGGAFQPVNSGYWDGFYGKIDPAASGAGSLLYSTQLGGTSTEAVFGLARDASGDVHLVGQTYSNTFPVVDTFQPNLGGSTDVFLAVIDNAATVADLSVAQVESSDPAGLFADLTYTITVTNSGPVAAPGVRLSHLILGTWSYMNAIPSQGSCTAATYSIPGPEVDVGCNLGSLASGNSATVQVVVYPVMDAVLTSTASVASNVGDPDAADNVAVETTTVTDVIFADGFEGS